MTLNDLVQFLKLIKSDYAKISPQKLLGKSKINVTAIYNMIRTKLQDVYVLNIKKLSIKQTIMFRIADRNPSINSRTSLEWSTHWPET